MKMRILFVAGLSLVVSGCSSGPKSSKAEVIKQDPRVTKMTTARVPLQHGEAGVAPLTALGWLKNGNSRFLKGNLRKDGQGLKDISRLSGGQKPHSIVLSCSDSRVPPEIVFDQKLGEIFVVRTAGQSSDYSATASIEYAIEHLGPRLIVVMGHTSCGAVKAAYGTPEGKSAGSPDLDRLVAEIRPRIKNLSSAEPSEHYHTEGWANARSVARELVQKSEIIRAKVESGAVLVQPALYNMETGFVSFDHLGGNEEIRAPASSIPKKIHNEAAHH